MAEVIVSELAKSVGTSVERLLTQMGQAGLSQSSADDVVSDEEKQKLLGFLKTVHGGEAAEAPKKITLKRKTTSTLKTGSGSSRKTVNVEVRKKRTYVKRDEAAEETEVAEAVAPAPVVEPEVEVVPEVVEAPVAAEEPAPVVEEPVVEPEPVEEEPVVADAPEETVAEVEEPVVEAEPEAKEEKPAAKKPAPIRSSFVDDAEILRQRALARRKAQAEEERLEVERKREKAEAERQKAADKLKKVKAVKKPEEAPRVATAEELAAKVEAEKHKHGKKKIKAEAPIEAEEEVKKHNKKAGKAIKKTDVPAPKKGSAVLSYLDEVDEDRGVKRSRGGKKRNERKTIKIANKHGFQKPAGKILHDVKIPENIQVSELAQRMSVKGGEIVKHLMKMGVMATVNQTIEQEVAQLVVEEMGHNPVLISSDAVEEAFQSEIMQATTGEEISRSAIVTVMGHVDHGKTSLLDYIREAKVASGEAGGITQHIGAYRVSTSQGELAFLDTPGHAAFTAMRARGAKCTDVVILVVAADDGVMPQTEEAIQHAKAAEVPMVVAINKCDKESADPDRVKNELVAKGVVPDDWGGDTQFIQVSAHTGQGIDQLLEAVALQAEMLELKAEVGVPARGVVIESRMDKGRGVIATLLVQSGTLSSGDILLAGQSFGRVRAMSNELGQSVKEAGPSTPVEILGLASTPEAGDEFGVVPDERKAREVAEFRAEKERQERLSRQQASKLENMFANMGENGEKKILPVVLKTDVRGSLEAISAALLDMGNGEVEVNIVGDGVGGITENDINLALTSGAIVVGFNVRADASARKVAERESIELRYYSIIYQLIDEVKSALSGMLAPERVEEIVGIADVREVFRSPKFGQVAGCMVTEGTVYRNKPIRVLRDNVVIFEGELESLRRFKDDVNEVRNGTECGIGVKNYDVKVGDQIEVFDVKEVAREL
ncbi:translation initiation factor IF-2 [Marinagarivorans cellulosilyticus]|uniref:Translation initiation factor IF-2 n=1 Tax=Marinagarivorans cellulosilyticus TaxID=2721545 RepID=A0AAN1WGZ4_9GAMM|nr:translation initiation factor IF-2 [Marinagarivorans cellulosilyticus]BCD97422.1 translation initiation factor IF-2 [Marinagarivorans cellulosilyticus]